MDPFWLKVGSQNRWFFILIVGSVFLSIFEGLWNHFGSHFGRLWELISATSIDLANKCAHHGFIAHGGEIKGPTAEQASKEVAKMEGKTVKKQAWKNNELFINFGIILGAFWDHFGCQKAFKNRVKFWMRFWRSKKSSGWFFCSGQAECAGALGRIMEGNGDQFRQRIAAEIKGEGQEFSGVF